MGISGKFRSPCRASADKSPRNSHHELKVKHRVICASVLTYTNTKYSSLLLLMPVILYLLIGSLARTSC